MDKNQRSVVTTRSEARVVHRKMHTARDDGGTGLYPRPEGVCDNTPDATLLSARASAPWPIELGGCHDRWSLPMSADANRCPSCGAERPANAQEGLCPRCLMLQPMTGDLPGPADVDATTAPAATGSGHSPEPTPGDPRRPGRPSPGRSRPRPRFRRTPPPTGRPTPIGRPARPTATGPRPPCRAAPPSATSAITRFRKSWDAGAWASSTRPVRSASTDPSRSR
jgi:hypothetical protein